MGKYNLKWLFTRWYFYVLTLFLFSSTYVSFGYSLIYDIKTSPEFVIGFLLGSLISSAILIYIVLGIALFIRKHVKLVD